MARSRRGPKTAAHPPPIVVHSAVQQHRDCSSPSFPTPAAPTRSPPLSPPPPVPLQQTHDAYSLLREDAFLVGVQMLQRDAGAARDAEIGVLPEFGDHTGTAVDELGHHSELGGSAGEDDSIVYDVGGEFWRRVLEHLAYCLRHFAQFARHRLHEFVGG